MVSAWKWHNHFCSHSMGLNKLHDPIEKRRIISATRLRMALTIEILFAVGTSDDTY